MINLIKKYKYIIVLLCIIIIVVIFLLPKGEEENMEITLDVTSPAFKNGGNIPIKYTGRGDDISIPLEFNNVISDAKSIAIIMDDPDAPFGTFTHWLIWNIPITESIQENVPKNEKVLNGAIQGKNGFGKIGYMGPNPPSGTHTYRIKVYVLDTLLDLDSNASKNTLESAIKDHILQYGLLEGKFSK
jgi:hypothetical protein